MGAETNLYFLKKKIFIFAFVLLIYILQDKHVGNSLIGIKEENIFFITKMKKCSIVFNKTNDKKLIFSYFI